MPDGILSAEQVRGIRERITTHPGSARQGWDALSAFDSLLAELERLREQRDEAFIRIDGLELYLEQMHAIEDRLALVTAALERIATNELWEDREPYRAHTTEGEGLVTERHQVTAQQVARDALAAAEEPAE